MRFFRQQQGERKPQLKRQACEAPSIERVRVPQGRNHSGRRYNEFGRRQADVHHGCIGKKEHPENKRVTVNKFTTKFDTKHNEPGL